MPRSLLRRTRITALVAAVALVAIYVPAMRAARVDPKSALAAD